MNSEFVTRVKAEITQAGGASLSILADIERELQREPAADLWILRGDAIQLSDGAEYALEDARTSYLRAFALDPYCADAYESLGHFTYAVEDDARGSVHYFQRAIELGAKETARQGLREAMDEIAEFGA